MASAGNTRVRWYERIGPHTDNASRWLRAAALLPEAVPRRFGDSEPLLHRFDEEGSEGLRSAEQAADGLLFLRSPAPTREAALATPTTARRLGPFGAHVLTTTLPPDDRRLLAFTTAFAAPSTVFVSISVQHDPDLGTAGESEPYLAPLGAWLGLPPKRPPWCWFGADYTRELARRRIALDREADGSVLADAGWVPAELCARPEQPEFHDRIARRLPRGLRTGARRLLLR